MNASHRKFEDRRFTVIIPTLNEAFWIAGAIQRVRASIPGAHIIVADGGSTDATVTLARKAGAQIVRSSPGRGVQCNAGAAVAATEILVFLHADTRLPEDALTILSNAFANPLVKIGTFRLSFDEPNWILRCYASFTRFDSIFTRFGDQCIAVRHSFFHELGDFPDWPLFEDVDLLRRARRRSPIVSFPATVTTSSRRFSRIGLIRNQMINAWLVLQYLCGVSPDKLATQYNTR